jgi:hypothetical protein
LSHPGPWGKKQTTPTNNDIINKQSKAEQQRQKQNKKQTIQKQENKCSNNTRYYVKLCMCTKLYIYLPGYINCIKKYWQTYSYY